MRPFLDFIQGSSRTAALLRMAMSIACVLGLWEVLATYAVTNKLLLVPPMEVFRALAPRMPVAPCGPMPR